MSGLQLEGARTNTVGYSDDLTVTGSGNWSHTNITVSTHGTIPAPDGTMTAMHCVWDAGGTGPLIGQGSQPAGASMSTVWARTVDGSTGTTNLLVSRFFPDYKTITGEWQRFEYYQSDGAGWHYTWDGRDGHYNDLTEILLWQPGLEAGETFATSQIPTTSDIDVTRNATSCTLAFTDDPLLPDAGVTNDFCGQVVFQPSFDSANAPTTSPLTIRSTDSQNSLSMQVTSTQINLLLTRAGVGTAGAVWTGTFSAGDTLDIRFKQSSTEGSTIWVNGVRSNVVGQTGALSAAATVGELNDGGFGIYKAVRIYAEALTDEEIEAWEGYRPEFIADFTTGALPDGMTMTRAGVATYPTTGGAAYQQYITVVDNVPAFPGLDISGPLSPDSFGAVGDGVTNDSAAVQSALLASAQLGVPVDFGTTIYFIGNADADLLCMPANSSMTATNKQGGLRWSDPTQSILVALGIRTKGTSTPEHWTGTIENVFFELLSPGGPIDLGRTLWGLAINGGVINNNHLKANRARYSLTTSGNNNPYLGVAGTRDDWVITNNLIEATAQNNGSEGIGVGYATNTTITGNTIDGVGDDPIAIHMSDTALIDNNVTKAVDGRVAAFQCYDVTISNNQIERIASYHDATFYTGIALIYLGFEAQPGVDNFPRPTRCHVLNNTLTYPEGNVDVNGSAIRLISGTGCNIHDNNIYINEAVTTNHGITMISQAKDGWIDPDDLDPGHSEARVHSNDIQRNDTTLGSHAAKIGYAGVPCEDHYAGSTLIDYNTCEKGEDYCSHVTWGPNNTLVTP